MPDAPYGHSNHWLTCILVDADAAGATRDDIRLALEAQDIEARPTWKPLHLQPLLADAPTVGRRCRGGDLRPGSVSSERIKPFGLGPPTRRGGDQGIARRLGSTRGAPGTGPVSAATAPVLAGERGRRDQPVADVVGVAFTVLCAVLVLLPVLRPGRDARTLRPSAPVRPHAPTRSHGAQCHPGRPDPTVRAMDRSGVASGARRPTSVVEPVQRARDSPCVQLAIGGLQPPDALRVPRSGAFRLRGGGPVKLVIAGTGAYTLCRALKLGPLERDVRGRGLRAQWPHHRALRMGDDRGDVLDGLDPGSSHPSPRRSSSSTPQRVAGGGGGLCRLRGPPREPHHRPFVVRRVRARLLRPWSATQRGSCPWRPIGRHRCGRCVRFRTFRPAAVPGRAVGPFVGSQGLHRGAGVFLAHIPNVLTGGLQGSDFTNSAYVGVIVLMLAAVGQALLASP